MDEPALRNLTGAGHRAPRALRAPETAAPGAAGVLAEQERRGERERGRYRALFQGSPDAHVVVDAAGVIGEANPAAVTLLGTGSVPLAGRPFAVHLTQAGDRAFRRRLQAAAATAGGMDWETHIRPASGPPFIAWIRLTRVRDAEDRGDGVLLVLRDLTQRHLEADRKRAARMSGAPPEGSEAASPDDRERFTKDFLALVSHELRAPLGYVRNYLAMLGDGSLGAIEERARRMLPTAQGKAGEMADLIEEALLTWRLDGRGHLVLRREDLREVASHALSTMAPFAMMSGHGLRLVSPEHPVLVEVDRKRAATIVTNLIDNALKYSAGGSEVTCRVTQADGRARVSLQDHGAGIPGDQLARLFTRFGRVVTPGNESIPGTGLGLYLSRELARMQGGDLDVESVEGSGSTFTLCLPAAAAEGGDGSASAACGPRGSTA